MQQDSSDTEDRQSAMRRYVGQPCMDALALPEQRSLDDIVAERLLAAITSGDLLPGERLVEAKLARRLGVSRAPLREALKQLEARGIVESSRGRGTYVRDVSAADLEQMLTVRALLEGLAARLCAVNSGPSEIEELTRLHLRMQRAAQVNDANGWRKLDWEFHEFVCRFSGNHYLLNSWRSLSTLIRTFLGRHKDVSSETERSMNDYRSFIVAIRDRDPDKAEWLFRSTIIATGFEHLGRAMPDILEPYVMQPQSS